MYKLDVKDYYKIENIIDDSFISVQLMSVINGSNCGVIYTDSPQLPETALIFHQGEEGFYFVGDPDNDNFNRSLIPFVEKNRDLFNNIEEFEFSGDSKQWDVKFREIFKHCELWESTQRIYLHSDKDPVKEYPLNSDFQIRRINRELFNNKMIRNLSFISDEIDQWWNSRDDYFSHNHGFSVIHEDEIIARCLLDSRTDLQKAIGIAVDKRFRKRGIAAAIASRMINDIISSGFEVYWECMNENLPSRKTAEKCGMHLEFTYQLFGFPLSID